MHGCTYNIIPKGCALSAKNDPELIESVKRIASELDIGIDPSESHNDGGCEDYTRMMKAVQQSGGKAIHFYVGVDFRQDDSFEEQYKNMGISLHSSRFDLSEKGLEQASTALAWILLNI